MNKDKNDVIDVKFTLNGKGFGVLAVGICWEQSLEEQNPREEKCLWENQD